MDPSYQKICQKYIDNANIDSGKPDASFVYESNNTAAADYIGNEFNLTLLS